MYYTELGTDQVTAAQLEEMTEAINEQMAKDFCPTFGLLPISWSVLKTGAKAKPSDMVITLMDQDKTEPGALGYHSEQNNGVKFGSILVDPCLKYLGSNPLVSVAQCLSHECCEAAGDLACDAWVLGTDNQLWAQEVCDPVESATYTIGKVTVSNFVTPAFFDDAPLAKSKFDHLGVLKSGFALDKGGYAVLWKPGAAQPHQVFGDQYPEWRRATKQREFARTARRLRRAAAA
jgi:hypothetical protein